MSNGHDAEGGPTGHSGVGQGPASDPTGTDVAGSMAADIAYGGPTGDLSGTLGDIEADIAADIDAAQVAAAGMEFGGNVAAPMGGWGTAPSATQSPASGLQTQASNPLDDMMAVIDESVARTGMPGIGITQADVIGAPGLGAFGGIGPQQGPGVGFGTDAMGEFGVPSATSLGPVGLEAGSQSQATPGATGGVTGGGLLGPAPGGPAQNQAAGQSSAAENFDPMGSSHMGQFGGQHRGPAATAQNVAGSSTVGNVGIDGVMAAGPVTQGTVGTLDSLAADAARKGDTSTVAEALAAMRDSDDLVDDEDEDYSGMPTGATVDQTVAALIQAIQDPKEAKNRGWLAHDLARSILGLPPSTPESRARDALSNLEAQGQQEAMEMDVSTGEDARAIQQFRAKYPWAKRMSEFEIQAYINSPTLLKLKLENQQLQESVQAGNELTSSQVNALWAPQSFSGLPGGPMQGMPGGPMQGMPIYQQQT